MVRNTTKNVDKNINKKDYEMIQNLAVEVIIESQNFIRNNEEISSLREIKRFNIFFKFYYEYFQNKNQHPDKKLDCHIILTQIEK